MPISRRLFFASAAALVAVPIVATQTRAQQTRIYANRGIAVDGTDVVGYFTQGKPVAGKAEHSYDWQGVTWRFSTAENRDVFAADPERYAPQYGGFCAWAVSEGYTASTTPEAWKIVDDKLYLNYSRRIQRRWEKDIPARIAAANANWPAVLN